MQEKIVEESRQPQLNLYEEVDLRPYIQALIGAWYWILGAAVAGGVLAVTVGALMPERYEAVALAAITEPRFNIRFDPRLETVESSSVGAAVYAELATSNDVIQTVRDEFTEAFPPAEISNADFRNLLTAETGADNSLLRLRVTHTDPTMAAAVANQWAAVFIETAGEIYGHQSQAPLSFLEQQLFDSEVDLETAEAALVAFQAENPERILTGRLLAYETTLTTLITRQQALAAASQEIGALRAQMSTSTLPPSTAEELTALLLQLKGYGVIEAESAVQLNVGDADLFTFSRADQLLFLDGLRTAVGTRREEVAEEIDRLDPVIKAAQRELQAAQAQLNRLTNTRDIARETYTTLARTVAETRITSQDTTGRIQLASSAGVPQDPTGLRNLYVAIMGAVAGGLLTIVSLIGRYAWKA